MTIPAPDDGSKRRVLVIHPGALGDVLLSRPTISAVRAQFPQHEIALLVGQSVGALLCEAGEVDRIFPLESTALSELWAGVDTLRREFRTWLGNCDVAVGWLSDTEGTLSSTLRATGVQSVCLKSASSADLRAEHQSDRYREAILGQDASQAVGTPLILSPMIRERGRLILRDLTHDSQQPVVVLHAGSGSAHKCLDAQCFAPVIQWLAEVGMTPVLLEGPADRDPVERLLRALKGTIPVIRGLDVSIVAGVLSHAELYVGHDSGVTHLAAALSIPTVACFGPTDARRWVPLGHAVSVVSGAPCACLTWSHVAECRERVCLQIAPERIIEACRLLLAKRSTVPAS